MGKGIILLSTEVVTPPDWAGLPMRTLEHHQALQMGSNFTAHLL